MRILFSVNGIGIGHATRSLAIAKTFKRDKVLFASYGNAYSFLSKYYPTEKFDWFEIKGESFSVKTLKTVLDVIKNYGKQTKTEKKMDKIIENFNPDIIISDAELVSIKESKKYGIPLFTVSNLNSVINNYRFIPKELKTSQIKFQKSFVDFVCKFMSSRSKVVFYPSFDPMIKYFEKTKITDLIVRKRPKKIERKRVIYVSFGGAKLEKSPIDMIINSLKKIEGFTFVISGYHRNVNVKNLRLRTFIDPFQVLSRASAVITTAGHSSISEALVYKKPILALPIQNHVEQLANAFAVKKLSVGDVLLTNGRKKNYTQEIDEFLKNLNYFYENIKNLSFKGVGAKEIHDFISLSI